MLSFPKKQWPDYLQTLAITFDFPGFDVKEKFEWEKLPKDIKGLIFEYLKELKEDLLFKQKDLRLVNKEFYCHFYKNKPRSCIKYSFNYHNSFLNLSKLLISKITPNQYKKFEYKEKLFYHLISYYFTLKDPTFSLFFIKNDRSPYYNYDKYVIMIMDYLKSIDFELKSQYLSNCLIILLNSEKIEWIENRFSPQVILDACVTLNSPSLFYKICQKYNIKPDSDKIVRALASCNNGDIENILKLYDPNQYVDLIFKIMKNVKNINKKEIYNKIFNLIKNVSDEDFKRLLSYFDDNDNFLNNQNLWPLFIKFKNELRSRTVIFFMTKELIPFDFDFIKENIYDAREFMRYIGAKCKKEELLYIKKGAISFHDDDLYCILYYIKKRFPEIYEEEFLSLSVRDRRISSELLKFPFVNKKEIIDKIRKMEYRINKEELVDDELYYLYESSNTYLNYQNKRFIKQCVIHQNTEILYKIFDFHKKINKVEELIEIINSCL